VVPASPKNHRPTSQREHTVFVEAGARPQQLRFNRLSTLERAIAIAAEAHAGQVDKAGAAYVLHPLRIMLKLSTEEERIVAVLHDTVEDTDWTLDRLRAEGFSETIIAAVDSVTKRAGEPYPDQVRRAVENPIGRRVKYMDMVDNSDLSRISNPTQVDHDRIEKYKKGIAMIDALDRGKFEPVG
jgi:(p)ppGpp synthase/HD superfamily hydrolase